MAAKSAKATSKAKKKAPGKTTRQPAQRGARRLADMPDTERERLIARLRKRLPKAPTGSDHPASATVKRLRRKMSRRPPRSIPRPPV